MKVYLDDLRTSPEGWVLVKTTKEVIELLKKGGVTEISLDYHLGFNQPTGDEVLGWLLDQVKYHGFTPPRIGIHTGSPGAMQRMNQLVGHIERAAERNGNSPQKPR